MIRADRLFAVLLAVDEIFFQRPAKFVRLSVVGLHFQNPHF